MRLLGFAIGTVVVLASAIGFAAPDLPLSFGRSVSTPAGLYAIGALRIAIGLSLVFAARASHAPRTLRVLGVIAILGGISTPLLGVARAQAIVNWMASAGPPWMRLGAILGMGFGAFLLYVFRMRTPRKASGL
jgi:hypothetical protein